eukprot:3406822-Pyramimonas_sp.AAC.1
MAAGRGPTGPSGPGREKTPQTSEFESSTCEGAMGARPAKTTLHGRQRQGGLPHRPNLAARMTFGTVSGFAS